MVSKSPESAQAVGLVILFPLAIVSNALVPTEHMPAVLRTLADWNPVSAVTAAARRLFGNPNPSASIHAWPMQHPVARLAALVRRAAGGLRAPGHDPLPAPHDRLTDAPSTDRPDEMTLGSRDMPGIIRPAPRPVGAPGVP